MSEIAIRLISLAVALLIVGWAGLIGVLFEIFVMKGHRRG